VVHCEHSITNKAIMFMIGSRRSAAGTLILIATVVSQHRTAPRRPPSGARLGEVVVPPSGRSPERATYKQDDHKKSSGGAGLGVSVCRHLWFVVLPPCAAGRARHSKLNDHGNEEAMLKFL